MLLVRAAQVIADADAAPIADGGVVIEGGRVRAVGGGAHLAAELPPGGRVLHLPSATLLPGLFDCHVHLGFDGGPTPVARMASSSDEQLLVLMLHSAAQ